MTNKNYTHVTMVIDRSGSMQTMKEDAQHSINNFMKEQSEGPGKITVTLYDFNVTTNKVFGPLDAKEAPIYHMSPTGGTALIDAMDKAITETGIFLKGLPESKRPSKVIFLTITDGEENSSRNCTASQLKEKVQEQTNKYDWEFIFLGANIDAFSVGVQYGITSNIQYANTGTSYFNAHNHFSHSLLNARSTGATVTSTLATNFDAEGNPVTNTVTITQP